MYLEKAVMLADVKDVSRFGTAGLEKSEVMFSVVQRAAAVRELTYSSLNLLRTRYKVPSLKCSLSLPQNPLVVENPQPP